MTLLRIPTDLNNAVRLDGLSPFIDFQLFQPSYQAFRDRSKHTYYNGYRRHLHGSQLLEFFGKVLVFISLFAFFDLLAMVRFNSINHYTVYYLFSLFFFMIIWLYDQISIFCTVLRE